MFPGAHPSDRPAIVMADGGQSVTYGELDAAANRLSRLFRTWGLQPGDHVALCVENRPEFLEVLWGAHYAGLLYTAISTRLTAEEIAYIVGDCGARVLVMSDRYAETAKALEGQIPGVERRMALGDGIPGWGSLVDAMTATTTDPLDEERIAGRDMLYSSGTTGRPKGISPTQPTLPLATPMLITPVVQNVLGVTEGDVYLSPAPLYHAAPLRFCMAVHQIGGTVIVQERFEAEATLRLIADRQVTHTQLVPTMFVRLLRLPEAVRAAADVSSLRAVVHAGAPCPPEVKAQMIEWFGPIIHEYYASTEACGLTWVTSEQWLEHPGTVGKAVLGVPHVVGDDGQELPVGETGRIFFSDGPTFEYHNDPERTREVHDERGWATCGDIGHLDADGFLFLTDRSSYTIITGGVNVYPQEAEDVLISDPGVLDAAVFGVPHEEFGEEVKAVVQPMEMPHDAAGLAALEARLIALCRSRLADVKCPRSIDFRTELPRHDTGKLYKRILKDEYARAYAAARGG